MGFKGVVFAFLICACNLIYSQKNQSADLSKGGFVFVDLAGDTIRYKDQAAITLRRLKQGSVVVRLKTNEKSVDAYRRAGQTEIADKIVSDRVTQNQKMYDAFTTAFTFCKVYFIYSKDTKRFLNREKGLFLNKDLAYDPAITFADTNFVFCEYGSVESFSQFTDQTPGMAVDKPAIPGGMYAGPKPHDMLDTLSRRTSTDPATTNGLFFSDKNLKQFHRPFPYTESVYFNNPYPTVRTLNNEMERVYMRLVTSKDFRIRMKQERKKMKEDLKKLR